MTLHWKMPFRFARAMWHAFLYWYEDCPVIAPQGVVAYRRSVCNGCQYNDRLLWASCAACHCFIAPKTQLSSESCPIGKWDELDGKPKTNP